MSKLHPRARGHLTSISSRGADLQDKADQVHRDLDEQKQALDERTAQLRAKRLAQKGADPDAS
jgi:small-conductance mechanosensitive channel